MWGTSQHTHSQPLRCLRTMGWLWHLRAVTPLCDLHLPKPLLCSQTIAFNLQSCPLHSAECTSSQRKDPTSNGHLHTGTTGRCRSCPCTHGCAVSSPPAAIANQPLATTPTSLSGSTRWGRPGCLELLSLLKALPSSIPNPSSLVT